MNTRTLFAADTAPVVAVESTVPLSASLESRTITGVVAPYNTDGMTSAGKVRILPGAIRLPEPLSRVKLLAYHSNEPGTPPEAVGVAIHAEDTDTGLVMTFKIPATAAGDEALASAAAGVKDGFSVELIRTDIHAATVRGGDLMAVAHVPIPAFDTARVTDVAATHHPEGNTTMKMTPEQIARLAALRTQDTMTRAEADELVVLIAAEAIDQAEADLDAEAAAAAAGGTDSADESAPAPDAAALTVAAAAMAPALVTATRVEEPGNGGTVRNAAGLFETVTRFNAGERSPELTAALSDVVYSASPFADHPAWAGELWDGNEYQRKFVPLLTQTPLTSMKVTGWRWVTPPEVGDWAGDKTEVPSNEVEVEDASTTAARLAGAHDIDRAYWDFGNTDFIESFYRKQVESYAKKSDAKALAAILAGARGTTAVSGGLAPLLKAAARAANEVETFTDGYAATSIVVNSLDKLDLIDVAALDVPAYLKDILNIDPSNFKASASVPRGQVIAIAKPAMSFRELPGVPIRVDAIDLARGGRDTGVFGYWATWEEFVNGIRKVTFTDVAE